MTGRVIFGKLLSQGKQLFQNAFLKTQKKHGVKVVRVVKQTRAEVEVKSESRIPLQPWRNVVQGARYRSYYNTVASQLRRKAAWAAGRAPLLAFGGLALASHHEERDIAHFIKESVQQDEYFVQGKSSILQQVLCLENLQFGDLIGQGCSAAVYEARVVPVPNVVKEATETDTDSDITVMDTDTDDLESDEEWVTPDNQAPTEWPALDVEAGLNVVLENEGESDNVVEDDACSEASFCVIGELEDNELVLEEQEMEQETTGEPEADQEEVPEFDLAVKMMFNYEVESHADKIMREMQKEMVPAQLAETRDLMDAWENGHKVKMKRLPPHPNIVDMQAVFVDSVPDLPGALDHYPAALPQRFNSNGFGRNKTLFVVMRRYDMTLREYLDKHQPCYTTRLMLLAQLLEAVVHLMANGVAHRDLKSDNILLDCSSVDSPCLVLGDFGCCLADGKNGLKLPYPVDDIDKGGNTALMAPEIKRAQPGMFSVLDYSKADLWGVGALAYEILGLQNPFYSSSSGQARLSSEKYQEKQLPPLPDNVPPQLEWLVMKLLARDPSKRPTATVAANVVHLLLWGPLHLLIQCPDSLQKEELHWWLAVMAIELKLWKQYRNNRHAEFQLKKTFLKRLNMNELHAALKFVKRLNV